MVARGGVANFAHVGVDAVAGVGHGTGGRVARSGVGVIPRVADALGLEQHILWPGIRRLDRFAHEVNVGRAVARMAGDAGIALVVVDVVAGRVGPAAVIRIRSAVQQVAVASGQGGRNCQFA